MKVFINERILLAGEQWLPNSEAEITNNIKTLLRSIECFKFHDEPDIYFSSTGIGNLIENVIYLDGVYAISNPINRLRTLLLEIEATNWINEPKQKSDMHYYFLSSAAAITVFVNNTSIAEATEFRLDGEKVAVLNLLASDYNETNPLSVIRRDVNPPNKLHLLDLVKIVSKTDTLSFILENRLTRHYNWNSKHGENGRGMIPNKNEVVSPLECTRFEAELMLKQSAVSSMQTNDLYSYDAVRNKFMVFKCDSVEGNSYHSFHPVNQNEIPQDVKDFLLEDDS